MKMLIPFFAIIAIIILAIACNTTNNTQSSQTKNAVTKATNGDMISNDTMMVFKKGGCFGRCPIYTMTIFENGQAEYNGARFTNRLGVHTKQLDRTQVNALKKTCREANLFQFPDKYEVRIPDLASSTLIFHDGKKKKSIFWKDKADDTVKAIGKSLEAIADDKSGWTLKKGQALPEYFIENEFIIQLKEGVDEKAFAKMYSDYDLTVKERVTPRGSYWTMTYNPAKIEPYDMLNKLSSNEQVVVAEFNKRASMRRN